MMDRRGFLRRAMAGAACSVAAHPLLTTVTLAESDGAHPLGQNRLIVVILRGAMDGMDAVQPLGDPLFQAYRPILGVNTGALPLDGFFGLHQALGGLMPLWQAGELGFVHAVSTPYRDKRSHFDGQDMLEAGTGSDVLRQDEKREGWLNRIVQAVPGITAETAYAIGLEASPLLQGPGPALHWSPEMRLDLSPQARLLLEDIYHDDPLFAGSASRAMQIIDVAARGAGAVIEASATGENPGEKLPRAVAGIDGLADFAVARLLEATRIAAFSLAGWDTHRTQVGSIRGAMGQLERLILRLRQGLGAEWGRTTLLAMTEFGRTARENGNKGTDHGTGGAMLVAGGAVRGGRVLGRWPGLDEAALYDRRDLMPTSDLRDWTAWALRGLYGFDRNLLEQTVFPGLVMGDDPGLIL